MDEFDKLMAALTRQDHEEHHRDRVCLRCLNRALRLQPWTHKPGERAVKVGRYVRGKSGGDFMARYGAQGGR